MGTRSSSRRIKESPLYPGQDEQPVYSVTTTPWGGGSGSIIAKLYDITDGVETDVTTSKMSGSPSGAGDVITLPRITALVKDRVYLLTVRWTNTGGQIVECWGEVYGER